MYNFNKHVPPAATFQPHDDHAAVSNNLTHDSADKATTPNTCTPSKTMHGASKRTDELDTHTAHTGHNNSNSNLVSVEQTAVIEQTHDDGGTGADDDHNNNNNDTTALEPGGPLPTHASDPGAHVSSLHAEAAINETTTTTTTTNDDNNTNPSSLDEPSADAPMAQVFAYYRQLIASHRVRRPALWRQVRLTLPGTVAELHLDPPVPEVVQYTEPVVPSPCVVILLEDSVPAEMTVREYCAQMVTYVFDLLRYQNASTAVTTMRFVKKGTTLSQLVLTFANDVLLATRVLVQLQLAGLVAGFGPPLCHPASHDSPHNNNSSSSNPLNYVQHGQRALHAMNELGHRQTAEPEYAAPPRGRSEENEAYPPANATFQVMDYGMRLHNGEGISSDEVAALLAPLPLPSSHAGRRQRAHSGSTNHSTKEDDSDMDAKHQSQSGSISSDISVIEGYEPGVFYAAVRRPETVFFFLWNPFCSYRIQSDLFARYGVVVTMAACRHEFVKTEIPYHIQLRHTALAQTRALEQHRRESDSMHRRLAQNTQPSTQSVQQRRQQQNKRAHTGTEEANHEGVSSSDAESVIYPSDEGTRGNHRDLAIGLGDGDRDTGLYSTFSSDLGVEHRLQQNTQQQHQQQHASDVDDEDSEVRADESARRGTDGRGKGKAASDVDADGIPDWARHAETEIDIFDTAPADSLLTDVLRVQDEFNDDDDDMEADNQHHRENVPVAYNDNAEDYYYNNANNNRGNNNYYDTYDIDRAPSRVPLSNELVNQSAGWYHDPLQEYAQQPQPFPPPDSGYRGDVTADNYPPVRYRAVNEDAGDGNLAFVPQPQDMNAVAAVQPPQHEHHPYYPAPPAHHHPQQTNTATYPQLVDDDNENEPIYAIQSHHGKDHPRQAKVEAGGYAADGGSVWPTPNTHTSAQWTSDNEQGSAPAEQQAHTMPTGILGSELHYAYSHRVGDATFRGAVAPPVASSSHDPCYVSASCATGSAAERRSDEPGVRQTSHAYDVAGQQPVRQNAPLSWNLAQPRTYAPAAPWQHGNDSNTNTNHLVSGHNNIHDVDMKYNYGTSGDMSSHVDDSCAQGIHHVSSRPPECATAGPYPPPPQLPCARTNYDDGAILHNDPRASLSPNTRWPDSASAVVSTNEAVPYSSYAPHVTQGMMMGGGGRTGWSEVGGSSILPLPVPMTTENVNHNNSNSNKDNICNSKNNNYDMAAVSASLPPPYESQAGAVLPLPRTLSEATARRLVTRVETLVRAAFPLAQIWQGGPAPLGRVSGHAKEMSQRRAPVGRAEDESQTVQPENLTTTLDSSAMGIAVHDEGPELWDCTRVVEIAWSTLSQLPFAAAGTPLGDFVALIVQDGEDMVCLLSCEEAVMQPWRNRLIESLLASVPSGVPTTRTAAELLAQQEMSDSSSRSDVDAPLPCLLALPAGISVMAAILCLVNRTRDTNFAAAVGQPLCNGLARYGISFLLQREVVQRVLIPALQLRTDLFVQNRYNTHNEPSDSHPVVVNPIVTALFAHGSRLMCVLHRRASATVFTPQEDVVQSYTDDDTMHKDDTDTEVDATARWDEVCQRVRNDLGDVLCALTPQQRAARRSTPPQPTQLTTPLHTMTMESAAQRNDASGTANSARALAEGRWALWETLLTLFLQADVVEGSALARELLGPSDTHALLTSMRVCHSIVTSHRAGAAMSAQTVHFVDAVLYAAEAVADNKASAPTTQSIQQVYGTLCAAYTAAKSNSVFATPSSSSVSVLPPPVSSGSSLSSAVAHAATGTAIPEQAGNERPAHHVRPAVLVTQKNGSTSSSSVLGALSGRHLWQPAWTRVMANYPPCEPPYPSLPADWVARVRCRDGHYCFAAPVLARRLVMRGSHPTSADAHTQPSLTRPTGTHPEAAGPPARSSTGCASVSTVPLLLDKEGEEENRELAQGMTSTHPVSRVPYLATPQAVVRAYTHRAGNPESPCDEETCLQEVLRLAVQNATAAEQKASAGGATGAAVPSMTQLRWWWADQRRRNFYLDTAVMERWAVHYSASASARSHTATASDARTDATAAMTRNNKSSNNNNNNPCKNNSNNDNNDRCNYKGHKNVSGTKDKAADSGKLSISHRRRRRRYAEDDNSDAESEKKNQTQSAEARHAKRSRRRTRSGSTEDVSDESRERGEEHRRGKQRSGSRRHGGAYSRRGQQQEYGHSRRHRDNHDQPRYRRRG